MLIPLFRKLIKRFLEGGHVSPKMHPIHCPVIAAESQVNGVVDVQAAVDDNRALFRCANRQDGNLGRINDGGEPFDLFYHA
jgi:hypothetical protein